MNSFSNYESLSYDELVEVAMELETHHAIFSKIWDAATVSFSSEVELSKTVYDKTYRSFDIILNKEIWNNASLYTKGFIISHEALHLILNHGLRASTLSKEDKQIADVAMDLVVNQMLVNKFHFKKGALSCQNKFIWLEDIIKDAKPELQNRTFEFYFNLIKKNLNKNSSSSEEMKKAFNDASDKSDGHESLEDMDDDANSEMSNPLSKGLSEEEAEELLNAMPDPDAGLAKSYGKGMVGEPLIPGQVEQLVKIRMKPKKRKWQEIINHLTDKKDDDAEDYQWARENRRFVALNSNEVFFPQLAEVEGRTNEKVNLMFFLDSSGSCIHLINRFFEAATSIDPEKFNIRTFLRDTRVKEVFPHEYKTLTFNGGGSDDFRCMEKFIQKELQEGKISKYPDAVFHITDGGDCSGEMIKPQYPERWHWFLTENSQKNWIPTKSKIWKLKDFE